MPLVPLAMVAMLAACTPVIPPDTAIMPRSAAGTPVMSDEGAMQLSAYALGVPSRTRDDPVTGARAIAAIDYLAGALYSNPRFVYVTAVTKSQMVLGKAEVRRVLGIDPRASSQEVVDRLIAAAGAMEGRDTAQADAALTSPAFTLGPPRTLAMLANLPYLPAADVAAQKASQEAEPRTGRLHRRIFPPSAAAAQTRSR